MILVTGGTGFLGAHLLYHLTSSGKYVKAIKREQSSLQLVHKIFSFYDKTPESLISKIEWVTADVLDIYSLRDAFKGATQVYHTAAMVSFEPKTRQMMFKTNVSGTANVVNMALEQNIEKLCHVSSIAALGRTSGGKPVTESTHFSSSVKPSAYSISKFESEREVWRGIHEGLNAVIVNPSVILGPGDWNTGSSKLFQTVYNGLKFYTKGATGFVDVNDVAKAMILLMESNLWGEQFIINSENVTWQQIFTWMAQALNVTPPNHKAGAFLSELYWRISKVQSLLTGKAALVTRETARTAQQVYAYDSQKILKEINYSYTPVQQSINHAARLFLQKKNK